MLISKLPALASILVLILTAASCAPRPASTTDDDGGPERADVSRDKSRSATSTTGGHLKTQQAKRLFRKKVALERKSDARVAEYYADEARIHVVLTLPDRSQRRIDMTGREYKEQMASSSGGGSSTPVEKDRYSDVTYTDEGDGVRIKATHHIEAMGYSGSGPHELLLRKDDSGEWRIFEEKETQRIVEAPYRPMKRSELTGSGRMLLVPMDGISAEELRPLAVFYRRKYGIETEVASNYRTPDEVYDEGRSQLKGEEVVDVLAGMFGEPTDDPRTIVIGVTDKDIFVAERPDWRFAFSSRDLNDNAGVVSIARMRCLECEEDAARESLEERRLRVMVTKNVGSLYYHLPNSADPRSAMYGGIVSGEDLDRMGDEF